MKHARIANADRCILIAAALCIMLSCASVRSFGLASTTRLSQLAHTAWRVQDGAFTGTPSAIAQTMDGYLWIGTNSGLTRFDGVRFVPWVPPSAAGTTTLNVVTLLGSKDGSLWIGTNSHLLRLKDGHVTDYTDVLGRVDAIVEDAQGSIWYARARSTDGKGPLCKVTGFSIKCFGKESGIASPYASTLLATGETLWIGHDNALTEWKSGFVQTATIPSAKSARGVGGMTVAISDDQGCVLAGMPSSGPEGGLQRLCGNVWQSYKAPNLDGRSLDVNALLMATGHTLWIGTYASGLFRISGKSIEHFQNNEGLTSNGVKQIFEDFEGNIWVVTAQGLDCFRPFNVLTYTTTQGLSFNRVGSVLASANGCVWIGNGDHLDNLCRGSISSIGRQSGLPGKRVTSLFEDHNRTLWVGVDDQLYIYEHRSFGRVTSHDGKPFGTVIGLAEDSGGDIWALTASPLSLVRIRDRNIIDRFIPPRLPSALALAADPSGGIFLGLLDGRLARFKNGKLDTFTVWQSNSHQNRIGDILVDPDGSVWGASPAGLVAWKAGNIRLFAEKNGLPCGRVNSIVQARNGDLWLSQPCGFAKVSRKQLEESWSQTAPVFNVERLDALDGALPGGTSFSPGASAAVDGTLWFANETVLQELDSTQQVYNSKPPPVHIEEVIADHSSYAPKTLVRLPVHTRDLEIDYTALSFVSPHKVQFRYKLEGWDSDWQDPGARRQAFYTNLRPGRYSFRVKASNNDGVWNNAGDALSFIIRPAFYQTKWFSLTTGLAIIALLYWAYWLRLRQIVGQTKTRMLERLSERERIARELHDSFFQGIQGLLLRFNTGTAQLKPDEPARSIFLDALQQSDRVMLEGRELVLDLRATSTDISDLPSSLARAGEELRDLHPAEFKMVIAGHERRLHPRCVEELYPLGREALYNAFRHARATKIEVELKYESSLLTLQIRDNGDGIEEAILQAGLRTGHWGLPGMQERAKKIGAKITFWSRKGSGTEVEVAVPAAIAYSERRRVGFSVWIGRWLRRLRLQAEETRG